MDLLLVWKSGQETTKFLDVSWLARVRKVPRVKQHIPLGDR